MRKKDKILQVKIRKDMRKSYDFKRKKLYIY